MRYFFEEVKHAYPTKQEFADTIGVAQPTVINVLNGKRTAGLELVIKMHRRFHRSLDAIIDELPPKTEASSLHDGRRYAVSAGAASLARRTGGAKSVIR